MVLGHLLKEHCQHSMVLYPRLAASLSFPPLLSPLILYQSALPRPTLSIPSCVCGKVG